MKKRLKGLISVFFFLLCIFAWKSVQEVRAAENVIRDFFQNFLHTCRSSFERRKPAETAGNL